MPYTLPSLQLQMLQFQVQVSCRSHSAALLLDLFSTVYWIVLGVDSLAVEFGDLIRSLDCSTPPSNYLVVNQFDLSRPVLGPCYFIFSCPTPVASGAPLLGLTDN